MLALFALLADGSPARAQTPADDALRVNVIDPEAFPRVDIVVTPPAGRSLLALQPGDITVTEEGRSLLAEVRQLQGDDLGVAIVVDVSKGGEALRSVLGAAIELIRRLPEGARTVLLSGDGQPIGPFEPSTDRAAALDALSEMGSRPGNPFAEAIGPAISQLASVAPERTTVVVLSGSSFSIDPSTATRTATAVALASAGLYVIAPAGTGGDDRIAAVTAGSGGRALFTTDQSGLIGAADRLVAELASQHQLSFTSNLAAPGEVTLALTPAPGLPDGSVTVDAGTPLPSFPSQPAILQNPSVPSGAPPPARPPTASPASTDEGSSLPIIPVVLAVVLVAAALAAIVLAVRARRRSTGQVAPIGGPPVLPLLRDLPPLQGGPPIGPPMVQPAPPSSAPRFEVDPRVLEASTEADSMLAVLAARMRSLPSGHHLGGLVRREAAANCAIDSAVIPLWKVLRARAGAAGGPGDAVGPGAQPDGDGEADLARVEGVATASLRATADVLATGLGDALVARLASALDSGPPAPVLWPDVDGALPPSLRAVLVHDALLRALPGSPRAGTMARIALGLSIVNSGLSTSPVLDTSVHLLEHRSSYLELRDSEAHVARHSLLLDAITSRSRRTVAAIDRLTELRTEYLVVADQDQVPRSSALIDLVVANPILNDVLVVHAVGVDLATATELLTWLDHAGIVRSIAVRGPTPRYRVAADVLEVLDEKLSESVHSGSQGRLT